MKITHKDWTGTLQPYLYSSNNSLALHLLDNEDGQPIMVFTVNLDYALAPGFIAIKNYSENEGAVETLVNEGIIERPRIHITQGFVQIPIVQLTDKAKEYLYPIIEKNYPNANLNQIIEHHG